MSTEPRLRRPRFGAEGQQPYWLRVLCDVCPRWADVDVGGVPLCNEHARYATGQPDDDSPHVEGQLFPWVEDIDRWRT